MKFRSTIGEYWENKWFFLFRKDLNRDIDGWPDPKGINSNKINKGQLLKWQSKIKSSSTAVIFAKNLQQVGFVPFKSWHHSKRGGDNSLDAAEKAWIAQS